MVQAWTYSEAVSIRSSGLGLSRYAEDGRSYTLPCASSDSKDANQSRDITGIIHLSTVLIYFLNVTAAFTVGMLLQPFIMLWSLPH
jgi:hypothetical protein